MSNSESNSLDIAIIGYAGRFPGARNVKEFWRNLCAGVESLSMLSDAELADAGVPPNLFQSPNYVKVEAHISGYEQFDAEFFGYGAREALLMDPQQRIFLESCWEALEDAGYDPARLAGLTGIFAGAGESVYLFKYLYPHREQVGPVDPFELGVGSNLSSLTGRVAHKLNFTGPSVAVQTACSTSLVAVHLAAQSLLNEECDLALAGAVFLKFPAKRGYTYRVDGILSPDGHCRTFDARARGTIFGSGVGVVVLKRLSDAIADGDSIRAVIKGTAINNDGALKAGFTAPSQQAQMEVVLEALAVAGVDAGSITYVEAHGTGTALGDPIEVGALKNVFSQGAEPDSCAIGSVKANIGHLDAAAGMAGLIKTVLGLENRFLPPQINFEQLNPEISFDDSPFFINKKLRPWTSKTGAPLRAGVSSFGLGGTNSHIILEEAPITPCQDKTRTWRLLPLSAKSPSALEAVARRLADYLDENSAPHLLDDVAYTYQVGRREWGFRNFTVSNAPQEASAALRVLQPAQSGGDLTGTKSVAFLLTDSAEVDELAALLYAEEPLFRDHVADCVSAWERHFAEKCPVNFSNQPRSCSEKPQADHRDLKLFIFEYSVAKTLMAWGVAPKEISGCGVGDIAAACLRGSITLSDAIATVTGSRRDHESGRESGAVTALEAGASGSNGKSRKLPFHQQGHILSEDFNGGRAPFSKSGAAAEVPPPEMAGRSLMASGYNVISLTAEKSGGSHTWPITVIQAEVPQSLSRRSDLVVVIGGPATGVTTAGVAPDSSYGRTISISEADIERGHIHNALGELWANGGQVDWAAYTSRHRRRRISAPTYPFEKRRYWPDFGRAASNTAPRCDEAARSKQGDAAPTGDDEEKVGSLFRTLLTLPEVGLDDSFTELGGDSLLATQLASRLRDLFGVVIPLREILEFPTIRGVVRLVRKAREKVTGLNPIQRVSYPGAAPLSFSQQRLWLLDSLEPGNPAYNISSAVRLNGQLDLNALQRSIEAVVARHDALRTSFRVDNGRPSQHIETRIPMAVEVVDLQGLTDLEQRRALQESALAETRKGFKLDSPQLFRAKLFRLAARESVLVFTIHHIIADGWSLGVLMREVAENYRLICDGRQPKDDEPSFRYIDYAEWQRNMLAGKRLEELLAYWRGKLDGKLPHLELRTDHPRPPRRTHRGQRQLVSVQTNLVQELHSLGSSRGATLYMTLLTAFSVLLHRYTGQTDLLIGSPIANRNLSELEDLIGCFINVLVMRVDATGNPSFSDLLDRVKKTALEAYSNQDLPFERLVEELQPPRDLSRTPIFQTLFVLQNTPSPEVESAHLRISPFDVDPGTSAYDLTLSLQESKSGLNGWLEYNSDLFDPATIRRMIGHFYVLLESIIAKPDSGVGELDILPQEERDLLLRDLNATTVREEPCLLHDLIHQRALQAPEAIAVCCGERAISYGELDRRSSQLGHHLRTLGAGPEVVIGLYLERSIEAIVGLIGILKAGAAYLPIDSGYPAARLELILKEAKTPLIVTSELLGATLPDTGAQAFHIDSEWDVVQQQPDSTPRSGVVTSNLAYVVYTSGSTGKPKGVMVPHTGLLNVIRMEAEEFGVGPDDRVLLYTTLSFDASLFEICMALGHGAQLIIAPSTDLLPTPAFVKLIRRLAITNTAIFPSALALLKEDDAPALRVLIVGGESCPRAVAERWKKGRRMFNTYGTSETTIWATSGNCDEGVETVYIGRAIRNMRVYILDRFGNPVPAGIVGEIYIGGVGLARGYMEMSALTAERFLPDPFSQEPGQRMYRTGDMGRMMIDGNIEFLGRLDHQIKVQGVRIELSDVESAILSHPAVDQVVVTASGQAADRRLTAYYVSSRDAATLDIRGHLSRHLPAYMIPSVYVPLEKLPTLPNGKVDHRALTALGANYKRAERGDSPPETDLKRRVAALVEETLGIEHISVNEDLFRLGAHSLMMVQLKSRFDADFGCDIPILDLFQNATVNGIAELIGEPSAQPATTDLGVSRARLRRELRSRGHRRTMT
ncbi:MAG: amino acid adenylation domain-containing protein [Acidobacteria bacterium]|nr:amino acid adenylation domain-containing protein [Acidobacteriota bacterium]